MGIWIALKENLLSPRAFLQGPISSRPLFKAMVGFLLALSICTQSVWPVWGQESAPTPPAPAQEVIAAPQVGSMQVQQVIEPQTIQAGQDLGVVVTLEGQGLQGCFGTPLQPVDAVVLLDTSPSAGVAAPGSNLGRTQEILRSLWLQMNQPIYPTSLGDDAANSRLAIVTVDTGITAPEVNVRLPFTSTESVIEAAIAGLQNGADSAFDIGMNQAAALLNEQGREDAAHVLIILWHDGFFASQQAVADAVRSLPGNPEVYVIGNTLNIRPEEQLTADLASVLAGSDRVFINPSAEELRRLFVRASGSDESILARHIIAQSDVIPANLLEAADAISDDGEFQDGKVRWTIAQVRVGETRQLSYQRRLTPQATGQLQHNVQTAFLDCNGFRQTGSIAAGSSGDTTIEGQPAPTTQSTLTAGSNPQPTQTASAGIAPSTPASGTIPSPDGGPGVRMRFPIPIWLLAIPILLAILILLAKLIRNRSSGEGNNSRGTGKPNTPLGPGPTPPPKLKKITPNGEDIEKGRMMPLLLAAPVFRGYIPSEADGAERAKLNGMLLKHPQQIKAVSGFNPESLGKDFVWQRDAGEQRVRTAWLREALEQRIAPATPLVVVYTEQPADPTRITITEKRDDTLKQITFNISSRRDRSNTTTARAYWIEMRFLDNPTSYEIKRGTITAQ